MKTIVVTGGSHGLGRAIAAYYAKKDRVIILSSSEERLAVAAKEIGCEYEVCDVRHWRSIETAIKNVLDKYGRVDVLINNAGIYSSGKVEDVDPQEASDVFKVNALGPLLMVKAIVPAMKQRKSGDIININSQTGLVGKAERTVYYGSKWALTGITKCLQLELAPFGIKVSDVYPGALEMSLKTGGPLVPRASNVSYTDVIDAIEYILSRAPNTYVPEIGLRYLQ